MFRNFKENLIGAMDILFRPHKIKEKIDRINKKIELNEGFSLVGVSLMSGIKETFKKYPTDYILEKEISQIKDPSSREELTEIVKLNKKIKESTEKKCDLCNSTYLFECNHMR